MTNILATVGQERGADGPTVATQTRRRRCLATALYERISQCERVRSVARRTTGGRRPHLITTDHRPLPSARGRRYLRPPHGPHRSRLEPLDVHALGARSDVV